MKPSRHAAGERASHTDDMHRDTEWYPRPDYNPPVVTEDFATVELRRRRDGWTAERQRIFINTLANTGSVPAAAEAADITPRSAYRLRNHPEGGAFAAAWHAATMTAANRLVSVAFERAINGTPRDVWREGRIVARTSIPSDRMLMFLLDRLNPTLFGGDRDPAARAETIAAAQAGFASTMAALVDTDVEADLLDIDDYRPKPPREGQP